MSRITSSCLNPSSFCSLDHVHDGGAPALHDGQGKLLLAADAREGAEVSGVVFGQAVRASGADAAQESAIRGHKEPGPKINRQNALSPASGICLRDSHPDNPDPVSVRAFIHL